MNDGAGRAPTSDVEIKAAVDALESACINFGEFEDPEFKYEKAMWAARHALDAALAAKSAQVEALGALLAMDQPWPLPDVLAKLIDATEHLLGVHGCDTHGHEEFRAAANAGRSILRSLPQREPAKGGDNNA